MKRNPQTIKPGLHLAGMLALSLVVPAAMAQEALSVDNAGNIGVGTQTPTKQLHVTGTSATAGNGNATALRVENTAGAAQPRVMAQFINNGAPQLFYEDTSSGISWTQNPLGNSFVIDRTGNGGVEFTVFGNGRLELRDGSNPRHFIMTPAGNLTLTGAAFATAFNVTSDVNAKRDIEPVQAQTVLDKLVALPVSTWAFKADEQDIRHVGPMAQDFHAAFGLGNDPTRISATDLAGVALAAIQAQQQRIEELEARLSELDDLKATIAAMQSVLPKQVALNADN